MTKNEAKGIWVFAEQRHGTLDKTALELLGKAAELKAVNGEPVPAILAGCGVEALAATLIAHGADRVIVAESEALENYSARFLQRLHNACAGGVARLVYLRAHRD